MKTTRPSAWTGRPGFSLVEVVMALGIVSFVAMALLGLFSLGLDVNKESVEELEATHIGQSLLAERRAAPVSGNFVLPVLDTADSVDLSSPIYLTGSGNSVATAQEAKYGLTYRIEPVASGRASQIYLCVYWPALAAKPENIQGAVELFTLVPLP